MKKLFFIILTGFFFIILAVAHGVVVDRSDTQFEEAKEFGRTHKNSIEKMLMQKYGAGSGLPGDPEIVIRTKWCKLALLAGIKALKGKEVSGSEQASILDDPCLQIDVTVSGQSLDFAGDYTVSLQQGGAEIKPEKFHADHFQADSRTRQALKGFPSYNATIRTYFKYDTINPAGKAVIVLKKDHTEYQHEIDLVSYK